MNTLIVLKLEMLIRVRDFGLAHVNLFPPASYTGQLFAAIAAAVTQLEAHIAAQSSKTGATLEGTSSKGTARANLLHTLQVLNATARAIAQKVPGLEKKFRYPYNEGDQALLGAARGFVDDALLFKDEFIKRNMPATFIEDLQADIAAFAESISSRNVSAGSKVQATASIEDVLDQAMLDAKELDPTVKNLIWNDKPLLEAWRSARHIERHSGGKPPKPTPPVPPTAPEPESA